MSIIQSVYDLRFLEEAALRESVIHRVHPLIKLATTMIYLFVVVSFDRYETGALLPLLFYPVILLSLADIPAAPLMKRLLLIQPLIIGVGILNPLFDSQVVMIAGWQVSRGWLTFLSIFIKSGLTVTAALTLIATTGMEHLSTALRMLKVPRLFVLQLLLTYRYISVLMEEAGRVWNAYMLRAPGQKGIRLKVWGSLAGQMLLRTYDRALRINQGMELRGFDGEFYSGSIARVKMKDLLYFTLWTAFFIVCRYVNIPEFLGALFTGGIR